MIKYNDSFKYIGVIKVQIKYKDKVIKSNIYKNKGLFPMFYGIVSGLAGNFTQMSRYLPKYIKLYYTSNTENIYNTSDILITQPWLYTDTPAVKEYSTLDNDNPAQVTFKFNIPFSAFNFSGMDTPMINKFCLCSDWNVNTQYDSEQNNSKSLFNAYFITNEPINLSGITDIPNYSIYLEWTIKIVNNGGAN